MSKSVPAVFITNKSSHNYSAAEKFGKLIPLTSGNMDLLNTSRLFRLMWPEISASSADDYILISGPSVANSIACSLFVAKHNKLNLLLYRRDGTYVERNLVFE